MVALSPKALRLINAAVDRRADRVEQQRWMSWQESHPAILERANRPRDVSEGATLPQDVAEIIISSLEAWARQQQQELESCPDWDEFKISDLDNELSYLRMLTDFIRDAPKKPGRDRARKAVNER